MTQTVTVKPGMRFTHPTRLNVDWRPNLDAGERYTDAPHVECVVTKVTRGQVYYRDDYPDGPGGRFTSPLTALLALGTVFRDG